MDQYGWKKTDTLLAFAFVGMWLACETFPMHQKDMWYIWPPIHSHRYLVSQSTLPCGWLGGSTDPVRHEPTSWEVCGLDGGHPCIWIASQGCQIFPIHSQDIWNACQPIHSHWSSYHNLHLPGDGWLVCRSCKMLTHSFGGMLPGLRVSTCIGYIPGLWDLSNASTEHVKYMATHPWPLVPCTIPTLPCGWLHGFTDHTRPGPTYWEVFGLDGGHPCV